MWIQVRSMMGDKTIRLDGLSKLTKIEDLREKLVDEFDAPVECQRLFYSGKILVDDHTLFDYGVQMNAIIQIMVSKAPIVKKPIETEEKKEEETADSISLVEEDEEILDSTYKMGDIVDCRDETMGAWFEAKIIKITRRLNEESNETTEQKPGTGGDQPEEKMDTDSDNKLVNGDDNNSDKENAEKDSNILSDSDDKKSVADDKKLVEEINSTNFTELKAKETNNGPFYGPPCDGCSYHVVFDGYEEDDPVKITVRHVRPRARHKIKFAQIKPGDKVMVNYNYDQNDARGYWYDAVITEKRDTRTIKELYATVYIGKDLVPMEKCQIIFRDDVFRIEEPGSQLNVNVPGGEALSPVKRTNKPECDECNDNPRKKCKFCACSVCGDKKDPEKQVLCDECDMAYHIYCLKPALKEIPDVDEWYCPECKTDASEVVGAGEKLKESKKKSKMASAKGGSTRDWGKGMACAGRTKMCSIVPPNHFGPIPGVEVGQMWKFRVQVSEAGVHRPHVAGISGRAEEGSHSLVLSGGYEDDVDDGEEFTYTGSGGRDLSGNKRTAEQSCDQLLTRTNRALAKNCDASINEKEGAVAKDWQKGKPVRVVRNCKGRKHSKYAPEEGNRYDGIYKVVKYWPDKGKSGYIVWRYMLRRDDPIPAPWTKKGKKRTQELGLTMEIPEGYVQKDAKEKETEDGENATPKSKSAKKKGKKRNRIESDSEEEEPVKSPKKQKTSTKYKIPEDILTKIKKDEKNSKLWEEVLETKPEGWQQFTSKVEELFVCICCQDVVFQPITSECTHNICKPCLQRSFKAEVYSCPACRFELGENYSMNVNKPLREALLKIYPGYETGR